MPENLTREQKRNVCLVLSLGCGRETAAKFVGCSTEELGRELWRDRAFAAEARRAEATTEIAHMRNVQNASRDEKHWRASVWWLERHAPDRHGRRTADAMTPRQLQDFVTQFVAAMSEEIRADDDRQRLLARMQQIAKALEVLNGGDRGAPGEATGNCCPSEAFGGNGEGSEDGEADSGNYSQ